MSSVLLDLNRSNMNKKDNRRKVQKQSPPIVLKSYHPDIASKSDEVDQYLKTREMKFAQIKKYAPKSANIVRQEISPSASLAADRVISLDKDMTLDEENLKRKYKKNIVQNFPATANTNGNNDRLVIELSDYLTLTKTKNIGKFILKPMSTKSEKVNPLSPIDKIIQTANTVSLDQVLKGGQKIKTAVDASNQEPQRTFLLVPQKLSEPASKIIKLRHDQTTTKKSTTQPTCQSSKPAKVLQHIGQINPPTPNTQLSSILQGSKNFFVKIPVSNLQEPNPQLTEKSAKRLTKVIKKIQRIDHTSSVANSSTVLPKQAKKKLKVEHVDHTLSVTNKGTDSPKQKKKKVNIQPTDQTLSVANQITDSSKQEKKKMNVVLRAHPYFSQHKPFIIKHQPAGVKATTHQSYPLENQPGILSNSEFSVVSISEPSTLVEEIKCEMPEQDINFMVPQESEQSESIDQVFPVALKAPDSDDFEYLRFEDDSEILTESDMQILGI